MSGLEQAAEQGEGTTSEGATAPVVKTCECDGTGRIVDHFEGDPNHWVDIGNGLQMGAPSGYSTRLCSCRKSLPKRDGKATWWGSSETVFDDTVEFVMFDEHASVSVGVETCISEDNFLVHRTAENAYYPCIAHLEVSDTDLTWLLADDLRAFAAMLLAAADKCDEVDGAATSTTGAGLRPEGMRGLRQHGAIPSLFRYRRLWSRPQV